MCGFSVGSLAQSEDQSANTTSAKAAELTEKGQEQKDIDDEITNARMRASLGSKSKWSFKSSLGFTGSSIDRPLDPVRPNYRAAVGARPGLSSIGGDIGINYRLSERDNLSFSTGVSILNPFGGDLTRMEFTDPRNGTARMQRFDISGLGVGWSRGYKAFGMQMISDAGVGFATTQDSLTDYNQIASVSLGQTVLADLGESNWQAGAAVSLSMGVYNGTISTASAKQGLQQSEYYIGLYPFAEYVFNDTYSFRTVFGYFELESLVGTAFAPAAVVRQTPYHSMGLGISLTRDIYLYPNIQFVPEDIRSERTNVALSTTINL